MTGSEQAARACDIPRAERIARLNDTLRRYGTGGSIFVTRSVADHPALHMEAILLALARYDAFDADNDPHGERDFGDLEVAGTSLLFKIDYYARGSQFAYGSDDPADPAKTERVLTIMLPEDW